MVTIESAVMPDVMKPPTQEAIGRLEAVGAKVLRTDQDGDIEVVSDGRSYWVR